MSETQPQSRRDASGGQALRRAGQVEVGRAYRCTDGIIRWVTHLSRRGYFHLLWLEEERGVWYSGGKMKCGDATYSAFENAEPYPAPQPGDTYVKMGVYGHPRECKVGA